MSVSRVFVFSKISYRTNDFVNSFCHMSCLKHPVLQIASATLCALGNKLDLPFVNESFAKKTKAKRETFLFIDYFKKPYYLITKKGGKYNKK